MITDSREDVKNRVKKAIAFFEAGGKEATLAELTNPQGQFVQRQLYVFALSSDGIMLAHPIHKEFVGKNFLELKDGDGKIFIQEVVNGARSKGSGFVDYKWQHPISKQELSKTIYFEKVDDIIICSGFYSMEDYPKHFFDYLRFVG